MNPPNLIFEKEFPVNYHELDRRGNITPIALLNYLQDAAIMHSRVLGVSVADLREQELTWVLSRIHLAITRYHRANETLLVRTWPSTRQGIVCCREFELLDNQGNSTGCATTSWAVLNTKTRRPVKLEKHLKPFALLPLRVIEDDFATLPELPENAETDELAFNVRRSDLDINNHVNNAIYAGWALETAPDNVADKQLAELEISFRAEAVYGESIISRCAIAETGRLPCCLHQIMHKDDGRELARLRTRWHDEADTKPGDNS